MKINVIIIYANSYIHKNAYLLTYIHTWVYIYIHSYILILTEIHTPTGPLFVTLND